jgi:hypothetical protein
MSIERRYAILKHSHAASDVTSGVFATSRLGTGTANASTFLRGDGIGNTQALRINVPIGTWAGLDFLRNNVQQWSVLANFDAADEFAIYSHATASSRLRITGAGHHLMAVPSSGTTLRINVTDANTTGVLLSGPNVGIRFGQGSSTLSVIDGVDSTGSASYQPLRLSAAPLSLGASGTPYMEINGTAPNVRFPNASTATSATAGANGATPAQVVGYLRVDVSGTERKIPYYAV